MAPSENTCLYAWNPAATHSIGQPLQTVGYWTLTCVCNRPFAAPGEDLLFCRLTSYSLVCCSIKCWGEWYRILVMVKCVEKHVEFLFPWRRRRHRGTGTQDLTLLVRGTHGVCGSFLAGRPHHHGCEQSWGLVPAHLTTSTPKEVLVGSWEGHEG